MKYIIVKSSNHSHHEYRIINLEHINSVTFSPSINKENEYVQIRYKDYEICSQAFNVKKETEYFFIQFMCDKSLSFDFLEYDLD